MAVVSEEIFQIHVNYNRSVFLTRQVCSKVTHVEQFPESKFFSNKFELEFHHNIIR